MSAQYGFERVVRAKQLFKTGDEVILSLTGEICGWSLQRTAIAILHLHRSEFILLLLHESRIAIAESMVHDSSAADGLHDSRLPRLCASLCLLLCNKLIVCNSCSESAVDDIRQQFGFWNCWCDWRKLFCLRFFVFLQDS